MYSESKSSAIFTVVNYGREHLLKIRENNYCRYINLTAICVLLLHMCVPILAGPDTKNWVGTWACAPYKATSNLPPITLTGNTLRQVVRVSIGGDTLRLKFSNYTFGKAISLNSVNIAVSPDGTQSGVTASTIKELKFSGSSSVTINAHSEIYSDPLAFDLKPNMRLAITIYYGNCESSADMTFHYGSRTPSYIMSGDKSTSVDFSGAMMVERWYTISAIEVLGSPNAAAVAVIGNSITDGYGLSGGLQNRWTDVFSERLLENPATEQVGVLNLGIGATLVTRASNGAQSGVDRFDHDILQQSGVRWVIIFYGVNDIGANIQANSIIDGIRRMVTAAHDKNIKVFGATITPFNGSGYYSVEHEKVRNEVNRWIRTDSSLDGFLDFDKVLCNPNDTSRLKSEYSNDWLHPNAAGYKAIGESINSDLFLVPDVVPVQSTELWSNTTLCIRQHHGTAHISFDIPYSSFVAFKVYDVLGKALAETSGKTFDRGRHSMTFQPKTSGTYVFSLKAGNYSVSKALILIK